MKILHRRRPLVAVTMTTLPDARDARKARVALYGNYVAALERIGLSSVLITTAHAPDTWRRLLGICSGLLLTGGYDIDPARYGQTPTAAVEMVDRARDDMEFRVLDAALDRNLPVLGICRGHQLINVHFGGTLHQDIGRELGVASHEQTSDWGQHQHWVTVGEGTRVHRCLGVTRFEVNSFHHQAIDRLGRNLHAAARSEDGVVEAIESDTESPWLLGVQWHPERWEARADQVDPNRCVFNSFAGAVADRADASAA